jgi:uncharacterized protein (DUF1697 family)
MRYVVLLRGINVGGTSKVPMADLRALLEEHFDDVTTYIASGNIVLDSERSAPEVAEKVDEILVASFEITTLVRCLVLSEEAYREVVAQAPPGFGEDPETYRYDVGFFMGVSKDEVAPYLSVHPEVDTVTLGERAFYHRRLIARASSSRLSKIAGSPVYASLTIRNWNTTTKLAQLL